MKKWKDYFQSYRIIKVKDNNDLLYQVGTTVSGNPISKTQHDEIIKSIVFGLDLKPDDILLDLCCGNGVITFDLAKIANNVIGIDSSQPYIDNAIKIKNHKNIAYYCDDILNFKKYIIDANINKAVFYAALAYFSKNEIVKILVLLKEANIGRIYIGSILDRNEKSKYFNTFKRKATYFISQFIIGKNSGLGNWWSKKEIIKLAQQAGFSIEIIKQNSNIHTSHYRFDALLINNSMNG
jgi:SAM-dependent methyltransferase